jgi:hypothetical protein
MKAQFGHGACMCYVGVSGSNPIADGSVIRGWGKADQTALTGR